MRPIIRASRAAEGDAAEQRLFAFLRFLGPLTGGQSLQHSF
jgi:hypothetical protein